MIAAACIVVAALIVLVSLETAGWAFVVSRYKRRTRSYTDFVISRPDVPPLVFPADVTMEELEEYAAAIEKAAIRAEFAEIVCEQFPQYRSFRTEA